jgi:hypothetical protein
MVSTSHLKKYIADILGICSSAICFVHCIASPLLLAIGLLKNDLPWLKYVFLVIAFLSVFTAIRDTTPGKVAVFLWASFWVFTFSLLFESKWEVLEDTGILSSLAIITGHIINIKSCRRCVKEETQETTVNFSEPKISNKQNNDESIY